MLLTLWNTFLFPKYGHSRGLYAFWELTVLRHVATPEGGAAPGETEALWEEALEKRITQVTSHQSEAVHAECQCALAKTRLFDHPKEFSN